MRSAVLVLAQLLFATTLAAQAPALRGSVVDTETSRPVAGAAVTVTRSGAEPRMAVADSRGRFSFVGIDPGPAVVSVRSLGYRESSREIVVGPAGVADLRIELPPAAIAIAPIEIIGESSTALRRMTGTATKIAPQVVQQIRPIGTQEILQYVPGVHGFADDGFGNSRLSIGIRGLNPRRSSRVLILEDGVPIQPAVYLYPNMYYNPPAERIDRVEVIKGSGAIRYGPQTMGGVVNYITTRPRTAPGARHELTGGTNGYLSLFSEIGGWGTERVQPEVQLLYKRGDGYRENNGFEQYNGTVKLSVAPGADRRVFVKANANYELSDATYTGLTEHAFRTNPRFNPKRFDEFEVFRTSLDVIDDHRLSSRVSSVTRLYLNYFDRQWWREDDVFVRASAYDEGAPVEPVSPYQPGNLLRVGGGTENHGNLRTFYVGGIERAYEVSHSLFGMDGLLDVGARFHWERFVDDKKKGATPDARNGVFYHGDPEQPETIQIVGQSHHYETSALSLHASERLEAGSLTVTPGVRFEIFEQERIDRLQGSTYLDKTSWVLLPGIGFNYALGGTHLFGGVHRGYTPPSSGTLNVVNFGGQVETGGLDLLPEKSWNTELGVRGTGPWLAYEAALFHITVDDLVAAGRGTAFKNLGRARSYGAELGSTLRGSGISPLLPDLHLAYTHLQTEVLEGRISSNVVAGGVQVDIAGKELPYAPRHSLMAGISRELGDLTVRADVQRVSEAFTDFENIRATYNRGDTGPVPAYTLYNASARYRLSDRVRLSVAAKNLLDEVYIGSRLHSNPGQPEANISSGIMPGPRRQINVGLSYVF